MPNHANLFVRLTKTIRLFGVLFLLCLLCACQVTLFSGVTEREANEMVVILNDNGVKATKVSLGKGLWDLTVDERFLPQSLAILSANGLPRMMYETMGDVFKKDGMVSTPTEERARLIYAIAQELSGTISTLDGVLAARVHLVLPEVDNFGNRISESKASVFIKHRSDVDLTEQITSIRRLVENSVRDLEYESISVFLFPSTATPPMPVTPQEIVLGMAVDPESVPLVWGIVLGSLVLVGGGGFMVYRKQQAKKADEEA